MYSYIEIPAGRLDADALQGLLEEFASRDGTDYGETELTLAEKTGNLRRQLQQGELLLLFETESEQWDLVNSDQARALLGDHD
ncbi:YheU family protein [Seongchinamella sediminis]|uniref:YheU family protein n=1 Tax=Seongchinamella sediminis TaxID=2283635 RepID=A0A3L7DV75_9GAMM|nr:YheU family protein [Seongchinamella sediminis]RLQ20203.1 YheU family protein [Seongchinamella sediminis]